METAMEKKYDIDELHFYLSEFGNFLRDNYYGAGAPELIPYNNKLYKRGTVNQILERWLKDNDIKP